MPRPDPARTAALEVLQAVSVDDAYANLVLAERLRAHHLDGRDAAFATELAAGTLRWRGSYDRVLERLVSRGLADLEPVVLDVLRLGCHQVLRTRVPAHAAVATSVELVRRRSGHRATGLVNAVLRKVARQSWEAWVDDVAPDPARDPHGHLAVAQAHPRWVVERLAAALGDRSEELDRLLAADNEPPPVTLVARPGLCSLAELGEHGEPTSWSAVGVRLAGGDPAALPAVREGRAGVQDEGSQLVALALAQAAVTGGDRAWTDLCAGPGGKTSLLGALAAQRDARVVAVEVQPHRADLVRAACRALPRGAVTVVVADGRRPPVAPGSQDRVLVDAPCTGLGALRRRPEARWRRTAEDLDDLTALQRRLLAAALDATRPGGVVAYATCSPVLAETAAVVGAVLESRDDVMLEDAEAVLGVPDSAGPLAGTVQLWPHRHGTDAMFLALLRRAPGRHHD